MNVGDPISVADLIAAWREGLRAEDATPGAVARSRIAQGTFGIDLCADPPALERTWTPDWVRDTRSFQHTGTCTATCWLVSRGSGPRFQRTLILSRASSRRRW